MCNNVLEQVNSNTKAEENSTNPVTCPSECGGAGQGCFAISKIYDWVKAKTDQSFPFFVPVTDLPAIEVAILAGHKLVYKTNVPLDSIEATVSSIDRPVDDDCACVTIQKLITVEIIIIDAFTNETLSDFSKTIQLFESIKLCLPQPLDSNNITIKTGAAEAIVLSAAPVDGVIIAEISICQDIRVALDVIAQMYIKGYCPSRKGVPCTGSVICTFGCDNPPVANCSCN